MIEFGKHIRRRRERLKLSQVEVAKAVGMSRPWLVAVEKGQGNPKAETITALAVVLSEDPAYYLSLAGRVSLTAESVSPVSLGELSPAMSAAVERAVAGALEPLLARLDQLLELIEERPSVR